MRAMCPCPADITYLFAQRRPNVFEVGPTLYKCYTNVLCLLGRLGRPINPLNVGFAD